MLTCKSCKDIECPDLGSDSPGCDDFTSKAIEEVPPEWKPTPADYKKLQLCHNASIDEINRLEARLDDYENAVAELVRWAQDETP